MGISVLKRISSRHETKIISLLLAIASIFSVALLYYTQNPFLEAFESRTYDLRFKNLRGAIPPNPQIAIIAIDDKSIAELGRFPWTRSVYAQLLDRLSQDKAKAVLFDAFFPEPENGKVDREFAAAAKRAGNVYLATSFNFDSSFQVAGRIGSIPEIENATRGVGHINFFPENDGVNRRTLLLIDDHGKLKPSLGLVGAMAALDAKEFVPGNYEITVGDRRIPVSGDYSMWINFPGPPGAYPRYSFADIVKGRIDPALLQGKILFVGATAMGIYDMRVTPFDGNTPGVEVHAAVADDILSGRFVQQTGMESALDILFIVLLGGAAYFLTTRLRLYTALPVTLLLALAYAWFSYKLFLHGHWVSMIFPPLAAFTALLVGESFRFLVLERSARQMRQIFSSYVSDKLVARLEKDPDAAKLGGDNRQVTVLFTDIKGFTSFSEGRTPQEVVARLNEYFGEMVQIIEQFDGTVDKFIGDGLMAYWGAPLTQSNHAELALACIHAMHIRMAELRVKWAQAGLEPFYIRGGLQSGEVVAGNIGCEGKKMEYTVIGDTVNQAARLESTAKFYGVSFLVGDSTHDLTAGACHYRELDRIRVVGKQMPVRIYEPSGFSIGFDDAMVDRFNLALNAYRARQWQQALDQFTAMLVEMPEDKPCRIYIERCEHFKNAPPPDDWDGVFNRREK